MTLPSFTVTGNLFEITGAVSASELVQFAPTTLRITFTPNLENIYDLVTYDGSAYLVDIVYAGVKSDGTIKSATMVDGVPVTSSDSVKLLANDPLLNIRGLQWKVQVEVRSGNGNLWRELTSWWIAAPEDGETINLATESPVTRVTPNPVIIQGVSHAELKASLPINVKDYGAKGDGTTDDSTAIQDAIDTARDAVRADYGSPAVVIIPAGIYRINSRIVQPPYVKVVTAGNVAIHSYVAANSAWHVTPLSTDATNLYSEMNRQQWMSGKPIDGSNGGFVLINKSSIGSSGTCIGLELGARTDLGSGKPMARYRMSDVAIQGYYTGVQWNTFQHFIANYDRFHIENCTRAVYIGDGANGGTNSGENVSWHNSVFAGTISTDYSTAGTDPLFTWGTAGNDMSFYGCSFDYATTVFKFLYGYQRVSVFGGHMENINVDSRATSTGGIAVSAAGASHCPEVQLVSVPFVADQRGTHFRGNMLLDLGMSLRIGSIASADLAFTKAYLCDSDVQVTSHAYKTPGSGPAIARQLNMLPDDLLTADTAGTSGAALTYWDNDVHGGTYTHVVDADSPVVGGQCLKLTLTGSTYTRYTQRTYLPCKPGDRVRGRFAYKFSASTPSPNTTVTFSWYDSEKVQIGSTIEAEQFRSYTPAGSWSVPDTGSERVAPAGAAFCKIGFQIAASAGDGVVQYRISDFHAYITR